MPRRQKKVTFEGWSLFGEGGKKPSTTWMFIDGVFKDSMDKIKLVFRRK